MKLCVPEAEELDEVDELVACGECFRCVGLTEGSAVVECLCFREVVGDDPGVLVSAEVGDPAGVVATAVGDPFVDAAEGFGAAVPHAARLAPPTTTAMITAGTRHILMLQPSDG